MTIGAKMKEAMNKKGIAQATLAERCGVSQSVISDYCNDKKIPTLGISKSIAQALDLSLDELACRDDMDRILTFPNISPLPRTVKRPRLGTIACGDPILAVENLDGYDDVPEDIHCDFTLKCKGDSMIGARIHDGDIVYIRQQPEVENGQIAAVLLDGTETTLKRVYVTDDTVTLQAENPSFSPIVVKSDRQFSILGKAVGFTSIIK